MYNKLLILPIFVCALFFSNTAKATHIYGAELLYKHLNGDTYEIKLTMYGDCSAANIVYMASAFPTINIYNNNTLSKTFHLYEDSSLRKEISPVCTKDLNNTSCANPQGTLPGAKQFIYKNTIEMPPSANWRIVFDGILRDNGGTGSQAGRSSNITNIINTGSQLIYLEAFLNNKDVHNSSPVYSSVPTPFYCINKPQHYNQAAIDPDNDSLAFSLIPALISNISNVQYKAPYSGAQPLAAQQGTFQFDPQSGQMSFTPDQVQRSLVVNKVEEYKNGVLTGSSMREMTFVVLDNCKNSPPTGIVDSNTITGGAANNYSINVCTNTPNLAFNIPVTDPDGDHVQVTLANIPKGSNVNVSYNGTDTPSIIFTWNTMNVPIGSYNMYVSYKDDGCPLFNSQTVAYTIRVVDNISVNATIIQPTNCFGLQHMQFDIKNGLPPRKITITNSEGSVISTHIDSTGTYIDSFRNDNYTLLAESDYLKCKTYYPFTVTDSGTYPIPPEHKDLDLCLYGQPETIWVRERKGAQLNWYDHNNAPLPGQPTYTTDQPDTLQWLITQTINNTCESVADTVKVRIHDLPEIAILNKPEKVCIGDGMYLLGAGGVRYAWAPEDKITYYNDSPYTYINEPTTYVVTGYDQYGCANTDTATFNNIELCCTFSYPDAFTPNNDGINDGWHPITYGNVSSYLLSVYDRWGQRIFTSSDPRQRWDGTHNGKPCELGTYYYYLRATCVTGHKEETKGAITLIR